MSLLCVLSNQNTSEKPTGVENMGGTWGGGSSKFDGESLRQYMGEQGALKSW